MELLMFHGSTYSAGNEGCFQAIHEHMLLPWGAPATQEGQGKGGSP